MCAMSLLMTVISLTLIEDQLKKLWDFPQSAFAILGRIHYDTGLRTSITGLITHICGRQSEKVIGAESQWCSNINAR